MSIRKSWPVVLALVAAGAGFAAPAVQAHSSVSWSVTVGAPAIAVAPAPVYYGVPVYAPPPPPVVYAPPVMVAPRPVYVPVERRWRPHRPGPAMVYPGVPVGSRFQDNPYRWPGARR